LVLLIILTAPYDLQMLRSIVIVTSYSWRNWDKTRRTWQRRLSTAGIRYG